MIRVLQTWLMFAALALPCFAQQAFTIEKRVVVSGLEKPEVVEDLVLVAGEAKPVVKQAALVELKEKAGSTVVRASKQDRSPLQVSKLVEGRFLVVGDGKIWVRVTNVDFQNQRFIDEEIVFDLGPVSPEPGPGPNPGPGPGPGPDPGPVPPDPYGNIGQRVATWTAGQPSNAEVGGVYTKYSGLLITQPLSSINELTAAMVVELNAIPNYASNYGTLRTNVNADIVQRWPMTRFELSNYYKAIAAGLGVR